MRQHDACQQASTLFDAIIGLAHCSDERSFAPRGAKLVQTASNCLGNKPTEQSADG